MFRKVDDALTAGRGMRRVVGTAAIFSIWFIFSIFILPTEATAATACGGDGQRGCCVLSTERVNLGGACISNAVELPGCGSAYGQTDCKCGGEGLAVFLGFSSSGHCVVPTSTCGGEGQRACCLSEEDLRSPNNPIPNSAGCAGTPDGKFANLTEVAGNVPEPAVCGGSNPLGSKSNGRCELCGTQGAQQCWEIGGDNEKVRLGCVTGLTADILGNCTVNCGGQGQALCFVSTGVFVCNPGYHPDGGVCVEDQKIAEPDCNCDAVPPVGNPDSPVIGYADLHLHMFANLGFGGLNIWGDAFDKRGGVSQALRADNYAQRTADNVINGHVKQGIGGAVVPVDLFRQQQLVHGDLHINDLIGAGTNQHLGLGVGFASLANGGVEWDIAYTDHFIGWPRWNSTTHQQSYYAWLDRARRGGLRLVVMLAVTNETMCIAGRYLDYPEFDCANGSSAINMQLAKAFELEEWLGTLCKDSRSAYSAALLLPDGLAKNKALSEADAAMKRSCAQASMPPASSTEGWFKVVKSPQEARAAIAKGQLAVVLGIEEANLFNCNAGTCTVQYVQEQLDKYFDLGVRHIFPIHNFDNDYGGSASWMDTIAVGNRYATDSWFQTEECPATNASIGNEHGYGFKLAPGFTDWLAAAIFLGIGNPFLDTPSYYPDRNTSCNERGLMPLGKALVTSMMSKGMIIDVDHMSIKALNSTIELAEEHNYPGIVASHALMFDLTQQPYRHERMRTAEQLQRIAALGGMIGAMTQPPEADGVGPLHAITIQEPPGTKVTNDCEASSKSWAQMYEWAVNVMTVDGVKRPVAFGTDFNGISRHNAPRFGLDACDGQLTANLQQDTSTKVAYPFTIPGFGTFEKQTTGNRTFDFNESGLAHVGLLPDMIADLKKVGLSDADLEPLFQSAEAYIQMWEKSLIAAANIAAFPSDDKIRPTVTATPSSPANANNWYNNPSLVINLDAVDNPNPGGSGVADIYYGYSSSPLSRFAGSHIAVPVNEGLSVLAYAARDLVGNSSDLQFLTIRLDATKPVITASVTPPPNAAGWRKSDVTVDFVCTDALSQVDPGFCGPDGVVGQGLGQSVTGTAVDRAGNSSSTTVGGISIDKTAPVVTLTAPANTAKFILAEVVLADWSATDALSGLASSTGTVASGARIDTGLAGPASFSVTAKDIAGNETTITHAYTVLTAAQALQQLKAAVSGLNLPKGTKTALLAKLKNDKDDDRKGKTKVERDDLREFINFVGAQRGKKIPVSIADMLIADARKIIAALAASGGPVHKASN